MMRYADPPARCSEDNADMRDRWGLAPAPRCPIGDVKQKLLWSSWDEVPKDPPQWMQEAQAEIVIGDGAAWVADLLQGDLPVLPPMGITSGSEGSL